MTKHFFAKPLTGVLFKKFRDIIIGINNAGDTPKYKAAYQKATHDRLVAKELIVANKVNQAREQ